MITQTETPSNPLRDWEKTLELLKERAHNHCEKCGVPNGLCTKQNGHWSTARLVAVHLDHNPNNNDLDNLRLLCPSCLHHHDEQLQRLREQKEQRERDRQLTLQF